MPRTEPFDSHTPLYEDWFEKNRFAYESEIQAVRKLLPEAADMLEIGAGTGRFALPLGISMGVEPSVKMREIARERGMDIVDGVAEKLPFESGSFDCTLMVTTICFVDDLPSAFREAYRVLRPGGSLIIGFIDRESPVGRIYMQYKEENVFYRIATFYTVEELLPLLRQAGFGDFAFCQTIFRNPAEMNEPEQVKTGYGEGSFVVIRAGR